MRCPICDKPTVWKDNPFRPFCSERCKLIDFGHWVDENYAVPSEEAPSEETLTKLSPTSDQSREQSREDF